MALTKFINRLKGPDLDRNLMSSPHAGGVGSARGTRSSQKPKKLRRRTQTESEPNGGDHDDSNWLVSYADMMTLLCGFFVMLFSLSKIDEQKFDKVKEEVSKTFKGEYTPPSTIELAQKTQEILKELGIEGQTEIRSSPLYVNIIFQSTLFFDTLSASVKTAGENVLSKVITGLKTQQDKVGKRYHIVVEGHTDNRPILPGTISPYPTNWELSGARASQVVRSFISLGFEPNQMEALGLADTKPEVHQTRNPAGEWDEVALGKNRRVIIKIQENISTE